MKHISGVHTLPRSLIASNVLAVIMLTLRYSRVMDWPAWDPYSGTSPEWSPREAIVDRYTQIGYTVAECSISGVYIWSLTGLLRIKSDVRQRRVMTDLIYINIIAVCLDFVTVILVFLNQLAISHPIQTFTYA